MEPTPNNLFQIHDETKAEPQSLMSKLTKKPITDKALVKQIDTLKKEIKDLVEEVEKDIAQIVDIKPVAKVEVKPMTMAEKYKNAWDVVYGKQTEFRRNEIDRAVKDGTFGVKSWDKDFILQIASFAESE